MVRRRRHEIFTGETNYPMVVREIEKLGYKGVFAMEFSPSMNDEKALKQTVKYLAGK
jgi:hydroxypyruvate isomerase